MSERRWSSILLEREFRRGMIIPDLLPSECKVRMVKDDRLIAEARQQKAIAVALTSKPYRFHREIAADLGIKAASVSYVARKLAKGWRPTP